MNAKLGLCVIGAVLGGISVLCFGVEYRRRRNLAASIRRAEAKGAAIVDGLRAAAAE